MTDFHTIYDSEHHTFKIPSDIQGKMLYHLFGWFLLGIQIVRGVIAVADLKGGPLSVLIALALRVDKESLDCHPSTARLTSQTGYTAKTLGNAVAKLAQMNILDKSYRHRKTTIYSLLSFLSWNVKTTVKESNSVKTTDHLVVVINNIDKDIDTKQQTDGRKKLPPKVKTTESQMDFKEWEKARAALEETGVDSKVAGDLCKTVNRRGQQPEFILQWIAEFKSSKDARGVGFLVNALKKNWIPPKPKKQRYADMTEDEQLKDRVEKITGIPYKDWKAGERTSPFGVLS